MKDNDASGIFVAVVAVIVGSIVFSGAALLVLREDATGIDGPSGSAASATSTEAVGAAVSPSASATPPPSPSSSATPTGTSTPLRSASRTPTPEPAVEYVVQPGDALDLIAAEFGVAPAAIVEENGLVAPYVLEVGQVLVIPVEE